MTITRSLAGAALAALLLAAAPAAAQAATGASDAAATAPAAGAAGTTHWGPFTAPGRGARAAGSLTASGEDHADIPAAKTVRISGKLHDRTSAGAVCGWAVFRVTYRTADGNLPFKHHSVRSCSYGTPKSFTFTRHDVYQVELKVCSEGRAAKPSLTCLYAGSWKVLYLSR
ncbi:hypothetical protein GCM10017673_08580 [Streptosporangium violaceochromogenes]|nr:hypothetical protein GCM10017673_08580 [Streptosporangium violaceochromogenes]